MFEGFSNTHILRQIEERGLVGSWTWNFENALKFWSQGLYFLLGLDPAAHRGTYENFRARLHPDDGTQLPSASEILHGKGYADRVARFITGNGRLKILSCRCELHFAPDARPLGAVGTVLDITDREYLDRLAREQDQQRWRMFEQTHTWSGPAANSLLSWTPSHEICALTGLDSERLVNENIRHRFFETEADITDRLAPLYASLRPFVTQYSLRLASGERRTFKTIVAPTHEAGPLATLYHTTLPSEDASAKPSAELKKGLEQSVAGESLRAARALLGWTMSELARFSHLSLSTVRRLEEDLETPSAQSRHRVVQALRDAGVGFALTEHNTIAVYKTR